MTTPARTAIDLARALPFVNADAAVDQALWVRRAGGPLTTASALKDLAYGPTTRRGDLHVRRVVDAATHLADNVRESQSRIVISQLGFPTPRLQERRVLPSGRVVFGDFFFPQHDHWAELDGRGKYRSPEYAGTREPADVVIDEKNRENEIRRVVRGFSRWEPRDVDEPRRLYDILTADGLPSRLPRP